MKSIKYIILLIIISLLFSSCLVSRMSRPNLRGIIVDYDKNPIANCAVGETVTDKNGHFFLEEKRYREFTTIGREAPPVHVSEYIEKEGYQTKELYLFNKYGGGASKSTEWNVDTIHLKSSAQDINFTTFIQHEWKLSATKKLDTLFLIKKNFNEICETRKCQDFYSEYNSFVNNTFSSSQPYNLPEGIIRRLVDIQFLSDALFKAKIITSYGKKGAGYAQIKPNDTIKTTGKWVVNKKSIELTSAYKELNGKFNFDQVEYEFIKLTK